LACGVCHSDSFTKTGSYPGVKFPRIPGHEVIGTVVKIGSEAKRWSIGNVVGRGWCAGYCFTCHSCRRGDFITCQNQQVTGISCDGGYAEYMSSPWESLVSLPDIMDPRSAAPLLCAGVTVFNSMRNLARPGQIVAVQGIGGLGHLAVQFGNKMGFRIVAISQGQHKKQLAMDLGAHVYLDSNSVDPAVELMKMGGASLIVCTSFSSKAISALLEGVSVGGTLLTLGLSPESLSVNTLQLISSRRKIQGWPCGAPIDSEDTLNFASLTGTKAMIETYPLSQAATAYERMMTNQARFRVVVVPDGEMEKREEKKEEKKEDKNEDKKR